MGLVVAASVIAFLTTEMDSIAVMIVLFCACDTCMKKVAVAFGRYMGLALLVAFSLIFPEYLTSCHIKEKLALLGFIPIIAGIFIGLSSAKNNNLSSKILFLFFLCFFSVIVTLANGGDNILLYISFFKSLDVRDFYIFCIVFFIMQALWCAVSLCVVNVKSIREYIQKTQSILIPFLFIVVGLYILLAGGTFMWLFGK